MRQRKKEEQRKVKQKNRIIVAMSGGLDSSVAAGLLKKQGYEVIGVFMRLWHEGDKRENRCYSSESENRARRVARILKIPFYVINLEKEFKKRVVDYFLRENKKGLTPNPCVVCNREIKFGLLLEKALQLEADYIATGHYAKIIQEAKTKIFKLLKGKDKNKDQSYFLWMLKQNQLKRIFLPLGDYTREQAERLAQKWRLPVLKTRKSVELCFIEKGVVDFLKKYLKEKPGQIIDTQKKVLGQHRGLWFYTIGQRKGLGLAGGPYWVLDKNLKKNQLIVTKDVKDLYQKKLIARQVNWLNGMEPKFPLKVKAKIRYRHQSASAVVSKLKNNQYQVKFIKPQRAITPGQSVVFYQGQQLLGGGIIC